MNLEAAISQPGEPGQRRLLSAPGGAARGGALAHHLAGRRRLTLDRPLAADGLAAAGGRVDIVVRLERPFVDPARCIGCGMCEHACPVSGQRAIRVYSENESRSRSGRMLI